MRSRPRRTSSCSDGEGSCSAADQAADKATRKARAADIAAAQKDLAPAQYGAAAKSSTNKQLLAACHNAALMEVEQLFALAENTAKRAAARAKDRSINFMLID